MTTKTHFLRVFLKWLPLAAIAVILCLFTSVAVQQNFRMTANDPQIQIAEDSKRFLSQGGKPNNLLSSAPQVDIAQSLAPFMAIFDDSGTLLGTSGFLNAKPIALPDGVLKSAKAKGEDRLTWEPEKGVRSALVVAYYNGQNPGFVVVGRSLKEIEVREDALTKMTLIALFATLLVTFLILFFTVPKKEISLTHTHSAQ